jgi:hypothetical protein
MAPEPLINLLATGLFIASTAANAWAAHQRSQREKVAYIARGRALEVVERMRKETRALGKTVTAVTTEELQKLKDALET